MTTSHEPAYPENGMPTERYAAYHAERAKAGIALAMTAGSAAVSKDSPPVFNNVLAYKDEVVPWIKQLTDRCHEHGCAVMIQLTHLGRRTNWNKGDWLPSVSATKHREPAHRSFPKLAEDWDIERIISDFADAAERMKEGGMDGIELQVYGHLLDQFWSPLTNDLTGPYGGQTLESRMRMPLDTLAAIRERVGDDFIVGFRYTADEAQKGGISPEEGIKISKILADSPTFHAAKIPDVATARHAIKSGLLDMVGMTRAHIADPHIVRKIVEKREHDIRPCVGANYCLDRIYQAGEALCMHNAATGRELTMPHDIPKADTPLNVVVVGAGPGGLEAARVSAERGHKVTVIEAQPDAGGQVRLTSLTPRRREMISIIDWRVAQCTDKGVEFKFNLFAEGADITSLNPDVVVVATGGQPNIELFESGKEASHVVTAWDIIAGDIQPAEHVLIYDESGDHPALQAAEVAASAGSKVEIMTPDRTFAPDVMAMNLVPYMRSLQDKDVTFTVTQRLIDVEQSGNKLKAHHELKPLSVNGGAVDHDALIEGRPQSAVRNPDGKFRLFRIGDAVSARNTHAAIYDALRLMKDI